MVRRPAHARYDQQQVRFFTSLRKRGFSTTACVAIARKIARLAFALFADQSQYQAPTHA